MGPMANRAVEMTSAIECTIDDVNAAGAAR
jgi:hypothetical protein